MRLELGGGENPRKEGFTNVDMIKHEKVDIVCDFEKDKLPFKTNSVDEISCHHCLEHIENVKHFLNECNRVLKKGAMAKFVVPYGLWEGSFKPVHKQYITECWFDFLRKGGSWRIYGYKTWGIERMDLIRGGDKNVIYEIECDLIKI